MSRIQLDYTNAMAEVVGPEHGLTEEELASLGEGAGLALEAVRARRETDLRWLDLPHRPEMLEPILEFDSEVRGRFENLVDTMPAYICSLESGAGFAELVETILNLRIPR